jgi:nucleoside 2-deoxyribosyltransferase
MRVDYTEYLKSLEWEKRSGAVRKRACGKCERCLAAGVHAAHCLTYARDGEEPLTDLLAVCRRCDEFISAKSEIDPMTDGVRVYLAGPITGTKWRDELLVDDGNMFPSRTKYGSDKNGLRSGAREVWQDWGLGGGDWPVVRRGLRDGFDFTGPWFEDITGGHGHPPEEPHGWATSERTHDCLETRAYVAAACRDAIAGSDVVFCWIPLGCSPYGSVWELGYATALNKLIILYEQTDNADHWWLAGANADVWAEAETPVSAWASFVADWKRTAHLRGRMLRKKNPATGRKTSMTVGADQLFDAPRNRRSFYIETK